MSPGAHAAVLRVATFVAKNCLQDCDLFAQLVGDPNKKLTRKERSAKKDVSIFFDLNVSDMTITHA